MVFLVIEFVKKTPSLTDHSKRVTRRPAAAPVFHSLAYERSSANEAKILYHRSPTTHKHNNYLSTIESSTATTPSPAQSDRAAPQPTSVLPATFNQG